jgi:hypothetical protein
VRATTSWYRMAMQIGMGFGKFLARVLFQELGVSVPSSVFHVLFITRSLHAESVLTQWGAPLVMKNKREREREPHKDEM